MEKFALLDFLKAFESLAPKQKNETYEEQSETTPPAQPASTSNQTPAQPVQPEFYGTNVMANVLTRHEEIANRIRNKK